MFGGLDDNPILGGLPRNANRSSRVQVIASRRIPPENTARRRAIANQPGPASMPRRTAYVRTATIEHHYANGDVTGLNALRDRFIKRFQIGLLNLDLFFYRIKDCFTSQ
jgi:hypothetical protein